MRLDHKKFCKEGGSLLPPDFLSHLIEIVCYKKIVLDYAIADKSYTLFGDYSAGVTPVPISNTEVKPCCADDTAWETVWESRSSPKLNCERPVSFEAGLSFAQKNIFF